MIAIPILLSLVLFVFDFVMNRKIYSPGVVFNVITFVTLFLYSFMLSNIQQILSGRTVLLLTMCIIWFNIPVFLGYSIKPKQPNPEKLKQIEPVELQDGMKSNKFDLILFIVVLCLFLIEVIYNKGFPLLWKLLKNGKTYFDFSMPIVHQFFIAIFILAGAYSLFKKKCFYKWFYLAIPILVISRSYLIAIAVEGFVVYLITARKKPKYFLVYLSLAVLVGIVLFGLVGNIRTGKNEFLEVAEFKPFVSWIPSSFKWVYAYMCFSISNLNNLLGMTNGFVNYGASSLNSIFHMFFLISENQSFDYLVSKNFTVSTFAPALYLDFGFFGPILFVFVIGIIAAWLYWEIEKKGTKPWLFVLLYAFLVYVITFIWFTNLFFTPMVLQFILVPIIFYLPQKALRRKNLK